MGALNDLLGFAGKAADVVLLGGAVGKSNRRNQFSDYLEQGQYDQAAQFAAKQGEAGYAQLAQQRGAQASKQDEEERQQLGRIAGYGDSIADPQMRSAFAEDVIQLFEFDDDTAQQLRLAAKQERGFGTLYQAFVGGDASQPENFGVSPQFIRQPDGSVKAVQFGNRGTIRAQDAGGVPLPIELRQTAVDQGQQRIDQGYALADPSFKGAQDYQKAIGQATGTAVAEAQLGLSGQEAAATKIADDVDRLLTGDLAKGRQAAFGALEVRRVLPVQSRIDAQALIKQISANLSIENVQKLKGPLSDKDITFLKEMSSRLSRGDISDQEAILALQEVKSYFSALTQRTRARAGAPQQQAAPATQQQQGQASDGPIAVNPQTGQRVIFRNGQWEPLQ